MKTGKVWLVGAGPGDIGLFTLKGLKVLEQADVVVYDSLVGQGVLSRIPENARLINVANVPVTISCVRKISIRYFLRRHSGVFVWCA